MTGAPRFGDAELSVLDYLSRHLDSFQGSTDFPAGTPEQPWIVARRYGGNYRPPAIDYARLSLESWGASRFDAHARLQEAIGALLVAGRVDTTPRAKGDIPLPRIVRTFVESGPQFFPEATTDCPRWISTVAVYMRSLDG
ncbi:hypothetical protein [Glycomyces sp. NPDC047010]|uniref:hypothetical protein n=1 Tax=Glycomyces sp. NPDC047010 TaxID=3155023 RepID=UPI00340180CF